ESGRDCTAQEPDQKSGQDRHGHRCLLLGLALLLRGSVCSKLCFEVTLNCLQFSEGLLRHRQTFAAGRRGLYSTDCLRGNPLVSLDAAQASPQSFLAEMSFVCFALDFRQSLLL